MWTHPGKKLLFMGSDFGQWNEWNYESDLQWDLLQWDTHQGVQKLVADLNNLYRQQPALYEQDFNGQGFEWIDCQSRDDSVLVYMRKAKNPADFLVVCCNFTPVVRPQYRVGLPQGGWYEEVFNSDSEYYGGGNIGNYPGVNADTIGHHGRPFSITVNMPPLGITVLKPKA